MAGGCAKKGVDTRTDSTNNLYNGGIPPIIQKQNQNLPSWGKEGFEQSSPPPPLVVIKGHGPWYHEGWAGRSHQLALCTAQPSCDCVCTLNCEGTMMCKVPYSSYKVVTAHRESPSANCAPSYVVPYSTMQNSTVCSVML